VRLTKPLARARGDIARLRLKKLISISMPCPTFQTQAFITDSSAGGQARLGPVAPKEAWRHVMPALGQLRTAVTKTDGPLIMISSRTRASRRMISMGGAYLAARQGTAA